ncbi:pentatricopeptide repeat-containing protein At3g12770 [Selaginella moellendorffii]|uniref:pentatricopeptide repeat-containing protein At3g12770 n=1 Tax=Selaginella moellendorffii TaxID=88036 RepID=UPI000D1C281C|nr:pentatricopeptide repeat-containing protein At3g12770 [Selaginella moellendorffii]|eukprot:XP_024517284.1 pentatricopeptide repeat-containing protein At3g12770 [Selaginella moellendorffii]
MDVFPPNPFVYPSVIKACSVLRDLAQGREIHRRIIQHQHCLDAVTSTALVDMYAKCGDLETAATIFSSIQEKTLVSWSAMISGYVRNERYSQAIGIFHRMNLEGLEPDDFILSSLLLACSKIQALDQGRTIHARILSSSSPAATNLVVETALMVMYANCGSLIDAKSMFDGMSSKDSIAWATMIEAYFRYGDAGAGIAALRVMILEGVKPQAKFFTAFLSSLRRLAAPSLLLLLPDVRRVFCWIASTGLDVANAGVGNALVSLFAACGAVDDAVAAFQRVSFRTVECWNSVILALASAGREREALDLFQEMEKTSALVPDAVTLNRILGACAAIGALDEGRAIHSRLKLHPDGPVGNSLVHMYAKCGSLMEARQVFEGMVERNVVGWTAMVVALAHHGFHGECLEKFRLMRHYGIDPDGVTFTNLLNCCSHAGLVSRGWMFFAAMTQDHGMEPTAEQYEVMVDLVARCGRLEVAEELMEAMPFQPDEEGWLIVLGASKTQGDVERACWAARNSLAYGRVESSPYVLLSNLHTNVANLQTIAPISIESENITSPANHFEIL